MLQFDIFGVYILIRFHLLKLFKCVASLQKGPHVAIIKIEIFVDLNRAGHNKSVKKKLAFWHKYLRSYGRFTNYIILIIILNIII